MGYWGYPDYIPVAKKKAKAARKLKQLQKKNPGIKPIIIEGRAIAQTWWGKSWNKNLERYADYSNRIGRGRSYVRHGAVLDLQIDSGMVESLVQGSRSNPYSVTIKIQAINKTIWNDIKTACEGRLDSLQYLLAGKFPKALGEIFTAEGKGLFPSPKEIEFDCTCPDWAYMCKHVAATLYGIGARLDDDPGLFFKLRKVKMRDLITQTVRDKTHKLLKTAEKKSKRVIAESDISDIFGIDLEEDMVFGADETGSEKEPDVGKKSEKKASDTATRSTKTIGAGRKSGSKSDSQDKIHHTTPQKGVVKKSKSRSAKKEKPKPATDAEQVLGIIRRSRKGVDVPTLKKKTGIDEKKIRNIVYGAFKKGEIKRAGRGIYLGK